MANHPKTFGLLSASIVYAQQRALLRIKNFQKKAL